MDARYTPIRTGVRYLARLLLLPCPAALAATRAAHGFERRSSPRGGAIVRVGVGHRAILAWPGRGQGRLKLTEHGEVMPRPTPTRGSPWRHLGVWPRQRFGFLVPPTPLPLRRPSRRRSDPPARGRPLRGYATTWSMTGLRHFFRLATDARSRRSGSAPRRPPAAGAEAAAASARSHAPIADLRAIPWVFACHIPIELPLVGLGRRSTRIRLHRRRRGSGPRPLTPVAFPDVASSTRRARPLPGDLGRPPVRGPVRRRRVATLATIETGTPHVAGWPLTGRDRSSNDQP